MDAVDTMNVISTGDEISNLVADTLDNLETISNQDFDLVMLKVLDKIKDNTVSSPLS